MENKFRETMGFISIPYKFLLPTAHLPHISIQIFSVESEESASICGSDKKSPVHQKKSPGDFQKPQGAQ